MYGMTAPHLKLPPSRRLSVISSVMGFLLLSLLLVTFISGAKSPKNEKPIIGILLDGGDNTGYSDYPWYALRRNYSEAIVKQGGIPIFIGYDEQVLEEMLALVDGILLPGGAFDSPPGAYTTGIKWPVDPLKYSRSYFEFNLVKKAYDKDIPILGICAGMQNMNLALGGTLIEKIKESVKTNIEHHNPNRTTFQHEIIIAPKTKLSNAMNTTKMQVNSNHHSGIDKISPSLTISAKAPDGVIEAFEASNKQFFVGVMWHPEFLLSHEEALLWNNFIHQAAKYRNAKSKS